MQSIEGSTGLTLEGSDWPRGYRIRMRSSLLGKACESRSEILSHSRRKSKGNQVESGGNVIQTFEIHPRQQFGRPYQVEGYGRHEHLNGIA